MRINKFLAESGVCSRRNADKLIEEGKVLVNGKRATIGQEVLEKDVVEANGRIVARTETMQYFMLNKPKGCVCTVSDDKGRKTVMDFLPKNIGRLYPVGRLDYDSEGLLIITNDGALTERLTHPRNEVHKTYLVKVEGSLSGDALNRIRTGVEIEPKVLARAVNLRPLELTKAYSKFEITIKEGKNREIRRMFEAVGHEVQFLKRIKIGELKLSGLNRGEYRKLSEKEIDYLKNL